jgi:hypothetical protein
MTQEEAELPEMQALLPAALTVTVGDSKYHCVVLQTRTPEHVNDFVTVRVRRYGCSSPHMWVSPAQIERSPVSPIFVPALAQMLKGRRKYW